MNIQTKTEAIHCDRNPYGSEDPRDFIARKLVQAEALSSLLYGSQGEAFREINDEGQDGVMWLLSDLITEVRIAVERRA